VPSRPDAQGPPAGGESRRDFGFFGRVICVAVSLTALGLVLSRVDLPQLRQILAQANLAWVAAAVAVFGFAFMMAAARWHLVLRLSQSQVHAGATLRTVLIGHLFNTVLFGPTGGDLAKAALYARWYGFPTAGIFATCLLDRFLGGAGFVVFASCMPGFATSSSHWLERARQFIASPRFALIGAGLLLLCLVAWALRRRLKSKSPLARLSRALRANAGELLQHPRFALRGVLFGALSHLGTSCVFLFALKAVTHASFSLAALFWIFPVISVITAAPVTFAGAGLREGAALVLLGLYGIPAPDAVAASLLVLLVYLVWALLSGFLFWRTEGHPAAEVLPPERESLSVVIPTLNEAEALPETVARVRQVPEVREILVVDGGSTDRTVELAERLGCRVITGPASRGGQLRLGAAQATGDVILLLHADTWLPSDAGRAILNCLRDGTVVGGGLWKTFREKRLLMLGSRLRCALRLILFGRVMGDQGMFVRRTTLKQIGGIPDVPLMEEFELCRTVRLVGRLALAGATVVTSARRFIERGVLRTYFRMWRVTARYYLGTPANKLRETYEQKD
jgi:rSAM/selenodomain-associated transferase 2